MIDRTILEDDIYSVQLLFKEEVKRPNAISINDQIKKRLGNTMILNGDSNDIYRFSVKGQGISHRAIGKTSQICLSNLLRFGLYLDEDELVNIRSVENPRQIIEESNYFLMAYNYLVKDLSYKERYYIMGVWLEILIDIFPECEYMYFKGSHNLISTYDYKNKNPFNRPNLKFLYGALKPRVFVEKDNMGTKSYIIDTVGLYRIGLPDMQYHIKDKENIDEIINHAMNMAIHIYENGDILKDGDKIAGLSFVEKSLVRHGMSKKQPDRRIIELDLGKYSIDDRIRYW